MPLAVAPAGAGLDHALEVAIERHRVAALAEQPAQILADVDLVEEQHAALGQREPFQRAEMREGEEPAFVRFGERRHREVVHDAAHPVGVDGALRVRQALARRHQVGEPEAGEWGQGADPLRLAGPGGSERPALQGLGRGLAE